jgi:hypothetical protein
VAGGAGAEGRSLQTGPTVLGRVAQGRLTDPSGWVQSCAPSLTHSMPGLAALSACRAFRSSLRKLVPDGSGSAAAGPGSSAAISASTVAPGFMR